MWPFPMSDRCSTHTFRKRRQGLFLRLLPETNLREKTSPLFCPPSLRIPVQILDSQNAKSFGLPVHRSPPFEGPTRPVYKCMQSLSQARSKSYHNGKTFPWLL